MFAQLELKKAIRLFEERVKISVFGAALGCRLALFARDLHAVIAGKGFDRLREIDRVEIHDKADGIAAGAAAKAIVKLLFGLNAKRRGFFVVKRATRRIVFATFFQSHTLIDHVDNVSATQKIVDKALRNKACHGLNVVSTLCSIIRNERR